MGAALAEAGEAGDAKVDPGSGDACEASLRRLSPGREEGSKWLLVTCNTSTGRLETKLQAAGARENAPELFQHQAPACVHAQPLANSIRN